MTHKHTNRLIHASSPYLLQHAHNPVDWYEWGPEAFEKAQKENKLVLVSIGYSACHWCHVMERECFEQEDTAKLMNEHFVCIKVDREERPDVDQVYMDAVQILTRSGGWPLNAFTLPDGRPLHGGTYFPKAQWEEVLQSLATFYVNEPEKAQNFAEDLTRGVRQMGLLPASTPEGEAQGESFLQDILTTWQQQFDKVLGGYTWAPKFPMPDNYLFLLRHGQQTSMEGLLEYVHTTLKKMADGGLYDQIGGGFARYSVDSYWKVPHFEKMLYDNAQLVSLYSQAYQASGQDQYKQVVEETLFFIQRELTSPLGSFYSALDADSEGVEGKYYVWTRPELRELLKEDESLFSLYYNVQEYGNWEEGMNILHRSKTDAELAELTQRSLKEINAVVAKSKPVLLKAREDRVKPGLDDKQITTWNALMIRGYVDAYKALGDASYLKQAQAAAELIQETQFKTGRLLRIHKDGKSSINGFLEDYAFAADAFISLYQVTFHEPHLDFAHELVKQALADFYDSDHGFFYFKSRKDEPLIARRAETTDNVIPSSNAVMARVLLALSRYLEDTRYTDMVRQMLNRMKSKFGEHPSGYSHWLQLWLDLYGPYHEVVITGPKAEDLRKELSSHYLPGVLWAGSTSAPSKLPLLQDRLSDEETRIFVCHNRTCKLPVTTVAEALKQLSAG